MATQIHHLSHPKYRPDIDGLRAVAVLSVVIFHAFPGWMKGGFIGVDIFFVISGFLISTIIFENLEKRTFSFAEFYSRRIRRIFPALIVVLIFCLITGWLVLIPDELNQLGKHIAAGAAFFSNFILWGEAGYFDNSSETKPLLHLWSLGIEEQFYLAWPLFLWISTKLRLNIISIIAFLSASSFILNIQIIKIDIVETFYSPQTRFWELLSGSILAWITLTNKKIIYGAKHRSERWIYNFILENHIELHENVIRNVISVSGCLLLAYGFFGITKDARFPGTLAIAPVLGAILIIFSGSNAWINRKILSNKIAVWFGLISFPLYLWHWPILSFVRIIEDEEPSIGLRITSVVISVALAWLTFNLFEKPFRLGDTNVRLKLLTLSWAMLAIAGAGAFVSLSDFTETHSPDKLIVNRKGFAHSVGSSLSWYRGKDDWLFLGNAYDNTVSKLTLSIFPSSSQVASVRDSFSRIADSGKKCGAKIVLLVGPEKSSIYPEYLPDQIVPSPTKYSSLFLNKIKELPNITVYDPTDDLLSAKESEGILYWMTDTHWNNKGAYLAYSGFSKLLGLPIPSVSFKHNGTHSGDLIEISKLKNLPLHPQDNWDVIWRDDPIWTENEIKNEQKTTFGVAAIVTNDKPLSNKYVWVVGDSFAGVLRKYFNATFKEVYYIGHWKDTLNSLPERLAKAERKPDLIVIVRVERSF